MNERKFLKQINNKNNKDGSFTCSIVLNLINSQDKNFELQKDSKINRIFKKIFLNFKREKSVKQIIEDNFITILEKTKNSYIDVLIGELIKNPGTKHIITNNFKIITDKLINDEVFKECDTGIFKDIIKTPEGEKFVKENIDTMLENISASNIFEISQHLKGLSENVDSRLNVALENNKIEISKTLLKESIITRIGLDYKEELIDKYKLTLSMMIDEILESEKCRYIDIKYLNRGSYSNVYQIGNKVIKIGGPRQTYFMPNHRRILQPLIRTNFIDEKDQNQVFACVEISDKVDLPLNEEMKEENLYKIFKDLRDDGIIWTDIKWANIGKLSKKNVPNLNQQDIDVSPCSVGFVNDKDERNIDVGDLVIIDTDYIYNKEDSDIKWLPKSYAEMFEKRYQQEKTSEIAKKYSNQEVVVEKVMKDEQR